MSKAKTINLRDLLVRKIQSLYDIENELIPALSKMSEAANDVELIEGFKSHLEETKEQIARLERIFELLGEEQRKLPSDGIRGIIKDGEWVVRHMQAFEALDANLIASASYIEHYEMAGYIVAREWASVIGLIEVTDLLDATLMEEKAASERLLEFGRSKLFSRMRRTRQELERA